MNKKEIEETKALHSGRWEVGRTIFLYGDVVVIGLTRYVILGFEENRFPLQSDFLLMSEDGNTKNRPPSVFLLHDRHIADVIEQAARHLKGPRMPLPKTEEPALISTPLSTFGYIVREELKERQIAATALVVELIPAPAGLFSNLRLHAEIPGVWSETIDADANSVSMREHIRWSLREKAAELGWDVLRAAAKGQPQAAPPAEVDKPPSYNKRLAMFIQSIAEEVPMAKISRHIDVACNVHEPDLTDERFSHQERYYAQLLTIRPSDLDRLAEQRAGEKLKQAAAELETVKQDLQRARQHLANVATLRVHLRRAIEEGKAFEQGAQQAHDEVEAAFAPKTKEQP